ncbi:MAG: hypothetical protein ACREJ2_13150 [Planctomycetota bacterium]
MRQKIEIALLGMIAGLLAAYVVLDSGAHPARANDSGGKVSVFSNGGQFAGDEFFLVDTDRKWIGMYTIKNNIGPRLVAAQNYQLADALAMESMDSVRATDRQGQTCENQNGWNVQESAEALEKLEKAKAAGK